MELMRIKKSVASLAIAGSLFGATIAGVGAAPPDTVQRGGAAGLVAAVVQAADLVNITDSVIQVVNIQDSLNNLTALNNVLNNSPILSNNDIIDDITVGDVNVLNDVITVGDITLTNVQVTALTNFLNANDINLDDVVGIAILSGGDLLVFTR
jgi:hypothetical protein